METFQHDINKLENRIARYIYTTYIQEKPVEQVPKTNDSTSACIASSDSADGGTIDTVKIKPKVNRVRVLDKNAYKIYQKAIFHHSRSCFVLDQSEIIKEDIRIMALADKAYEEQPSNFKVSDYELPPDVLRCSFIRKHHNHYYRCHNKIMNTDSDVCRTHETSDNIYYDNYNDLLEKIENANAPETTHAKNT